MSKSPTSFFRKLEELKSVSVERLLSNNAAIFCEAPSIEFSSRLNNGSQFIKGNLEKSGHAVTAFSQNKVVNLLH